MNEWRIKWKKADKENKPMYVLGDFNIDVSPWLNPEEPTTTYQNSMKKRLDLLLEMASEGSLEIIPTEPTRRQGLHPPSTLDLILTNSKETMVDINLTPSSSDHDILSFKKVGKPNINQTKTKIIRSFKKYSKEKIIQQINTPMLMSLLDCQDPELVANVLISHITAAINIIAPMKTVQIRNNYAPYLTEQTKGEMKNRDANKKKAHISGEKKDWDEYKILRNKIKNNRKRRKSNGH